MTPSALTPAARRTGKGKSAGHPADVRRSASPRSPRRVSGPAGGIARPKGSGSTSGAVAAPERPATRRSTTEAPQRQQTRRSSGPAPRRELKPRRAAKRTLPAGAPWHARAVAYVRSLPNHSLLDRIIRGRAWIPLLGVLLAGIVAMQVEVLKLNAGIGVSLERSTTLQSQNQLLRANVARLADDARIESLAASQDGMVMPAPALDKFVSDGEGQLRAAIRNIHQPNPTNFAAALTAAQTAAAALTDSAPTGTGGTATGAATGGTATDTSGTTSGTTGTTGTTTSTGTTDAAATTDGTTAGTTAGTTDVAPAATGAAATDAPTTAGTTDTGAAGNTGTGVATPTSPSTSDTSSASGGVGTGG
jgi:hypothetical protein